MGELMLLNYKTLCSTMSAQEEANQLSAILLLCGYARGSNGNLAIPHDIISSICFKYYYLQTIHYFKPNKYAIIDEQNHILGVNKENAKANTSLNSFAYCISQIGWNKGKNMMSIKVLHHSYCSHPGHGLSIGILTNNDANTDDTWLFDYNGSGLTYQFYFHCKEQDLDEENSGVYQLKNGVSSHMECIKKRDIHDSQSDDIMIDKEISMSIDCDNWTLQFFYDGAKIGNQICIEKDTTYYAAIAYNTYPSDNSQNPFANYKLTILIK